MATFEQTGQTAQGPQFNAGRDVNVDHLGDTIDTRGGDYVGRDKIINSYVQERTIVSVKSLAELERLPPTPGEAPYKGLAYFTEADADIFFGRETLSDQLVARLHTTHFLTLIGASGSGKSSLLRAGVIPRLRARNWRIHVIKPGGKPLTALAGALTPTDSLPSMIKAMRAALAQNVETLELTAAGLVAQADSERLLLAIDQFEELFTQCKDEQERQMFVANLVHAARARGATTILLSMRADFYGYIGEHPELIDLVSQMQEYVKPMAQEDLVRVVAEPARRGEWQLQEGLVDQILDDVGREPGRLPLLSHALLEMWKRRRGTVMTLSGYQEAGAVKGAIRHLADAALNSLHNEDQRRIARQLFLRLAHTGEGVKPTRRRVTRDELTLRAFRREDVDEVVNLLLNHRLIVQGQESLTEGHGNESNDNLYVELIHEALIHEWSTFAEWIEKDHEIQRLLQPLTEAAERWEQNNRDPSYLYSGARLGQARSKISRERLNTLETAFLETSRIKERGSKRERRGMLVIAGMAAVLIIGVVITATVNRFRLERDRSQARNTLVMIGEGSVTLGLQNSVVEVNFEPYSIQKHEVSVGNYCLCWKHNECQLPDYLSNTMCEEKGAHWRLPVVDVTARNALDFCQWVGGRLPSWAEWERAARGPESDLWPWGPRTPIPKQVNAVFINIDPPKLPEGVVAVDDPDYENGATSYGDEEGIYHMVGNVWEWTSTSNRCDKYACTEVWNGVSESDLLLAGGAFSSGVIPDITYSISRRTPSVDIGFRCVVNQQ